MSLGDVWGELVIYFEETEDVPKHMIGSGNKVVIEINSDLLAVEEFVIMFRV